MNYYNDNDPYCCAWLRNLLAAGHLPAGEVDERPIQSVTADDVRRFRQCHFFAGIGGWPLALKLAGWPVEREVWTGSCPCQPFSVAGQRQGTADERHLWPEFRRLITECCPASVAGEQVAGKDGRTWVAGIRADLEALGYAVGAADLCAAGAGAPQVRQRLYWISHAEGLRSRPKESGNSAQKTYAGWPDEASPNRRFIDSFGNHYRVPESDVPFVAYGFPEIMGRIRATGNAIVPPLAQAFIESVMDCIPE